MIKTAMSFALGCALLLQIPTLPSSNYLWLFLPALFLLKFRSFQSVSIICLGMLWTLLYSHQLIEQRLPDEVVGKEITITGLVASIPVQDQYKLRFEFKPLSSEIESLPERIILSSYSPLPEKLNAGDTWQISVKLKQPHGMMNPGGFDYEAWLFQQHIGAVGYVRSSTNNRKLASAPRFAINKLRQTLTDHIQTHLHESQHYGLIQGLTTGIKSNISQTQWQELRRTGTSHLLAISGLHIGLAAMIGFIMIRWIWSIRAANLLILSSMEAGALGGLIFALFYAAMAGFSIPTQRALIMVAAAMLALLMRRPVDIQRTLALALSLVLIWDPVSVLSPGMWLSFSAVAIIILISQNHIPSIKWQWLKIHTQLAVGLSPLLLLFFSQTSIIAPLANLIAVPFISFIIVPITLFASCLIWFFEPLGVLLFQLADVLISYFWIFLSHLAALPFASWTGPTLPNLNWLIVIISTVILLLPKATPAKWLAFLGLIPLLLSSSPRPESGSFWFNLLDVGQGLSAVIQTKNHTLVFDAGPKFSDSFDTGQAIVLPFLNYQGITHLDKLIISHSDNDHIGGAQSLINNLAIDHILSSEIKSLAQAKTCLSNESWQWDGVTFSILNPSPNDVGTDNNLSCVLKVSTSGNQSVLLTGDIEVETEQKLIGRYANKLKSSILVAPHHGSKTSSSPEFISYVSPEIVLFPVGYANRYHFPAKEVVDRYQHAGVTHLNTADNGAILIKFTNNQTSEVISWRQYARKLWTVQPKTTD